MRCKNYEPKDGIAYWNARYCTDDLQAKYDALQAKYDALCLELNHIKRTTPTTVGLLNEKQKLQDENDVLHAHLDTLKHNYMNLYDKHQRTLGELNDFKDPAKWKPTPTTTYLGKPLEYWTDLESKNIDLQERIDKANDQLCAFRNLFADGV